MLLKTLFTLAIILGVFYFMRGGRRPRFAPSSPAPAARPMRRFIRWAAAATVALMLIGTSVTIYLSWERGREIVNIRIINSTTGGVARYQALRSEIDPDAGRFRTLDGEVVKTAAVERMEFGKD